MPRVFYAAGFVLLSLLGCDTGIEPQRPASISLPASALTFHAIGDTIAITATVLDQSGNPMEGEAVEWSSDNTAVVVVDSAGHAVSAGAGSAIITASSGAASGALDVVVDQVPSTVVLTPPEGAAFPTDTLRIIGEARDANGVTIEGASFTWRSSDSLIVRVDGTGLATAVAPGTATISAANEDVEGTLDLEVTGVELRAAALGTGAAHTCGIADSGSTHCWGDNSAGQIGDGTTVQRSSPTQVQLTVDKLVAISAGGSHTCGIGEQGTAYCWGGDAFGQLGNGAGGDQHVPAPVEASVSFTAIAAGWYHACGIAEGGAVYCWGYNPNGQLGDGTTTDRQMPTLVTGGIEFAAVSAGRYHTCALSVAGKAYCWGGNAFGEIGNSRTANHTEPTLVSEALRFTTLTTGASHTCAVAPEGEAYCWGLNVAGQLGDGTLSNRFAPTPVAGDHPMTAVTGALGHSCGLVAAGQLYCWGDNGSGQLGLGNNTAQTEPAAAAGTSVFASVGAGDHHTCGIGSDGAAYCWGRNVEGQLGDGSTDSAAEPVAVAAGFTFVQW